MHAEEKEGAMGHREERKKKKKIWCLAKEREEGMHVSDEGSGGH